MSARVKASKERPREGNTKRVCIDRQPRFFDESNQGVVPPPWFDESDQGIVPPPQSTQKALQTQPKSDPKHPKRDPKAPHTSSPAALRTCFSASPNPLLCCPSRPPSHHFTPRKASLHCCPNRLFCATETDKTAFGEKTSLAE